MKKHIFKLEGDSNLVIKLLQENGEYVLEVDISDVDSTCVPDIRFKDYDGGTSNLVSSSRRRSGEVDIVIRNNK